MSKLLEEVCSLKITNLTWFESRTRSGQKTWIRITKPNLIQKSNTESKPKLVKYPNGSIILLSREL